MQRLDEGGLVPLLEAIYAVEADDRAWLSGVLSAIAEACGVHHSYLGYFYDASDMQTLDVWNVCTTHFPPELEEGFRAWRGMVNPALMRKTFRSLHVGSTRRTGLPYQAPLLALRERVGWGDIFNVNGLDPSGIGCVVTIGTREREFTPARGEMVAYKRIAHHLAAAFRCRRRLGVMTPANEASVSPDHGAAEAILDERGRFCHAEGEATPKSARERIRSAAAAIESARTKKRKSGQWALARWHPLVSARWTLVQTFETDGKRYVVARENQSHAGGVEALTERERQVVLQAILGFTNKEIAYSLGISDSTVRVLFARAARRIGVRSREAVLAHPSLQQLRAGRSTGA